MDGLPWHLQLKIYGLVGIDALRALRVAPGRIDVPSALRAALERSMRRKSNDDLRFSCIYPYAEAVLPIAAASDKQYILTRWLDGGPVEWNVTLRERIGPSSCRDTHGSVMHR